MGFLPTKFGKMLNVPRRWESLESMVPVMVLHSVRPSRRWKSPSTENTPAHSVARSPLSAVPLASGDARAAERSSLEAHTFTAQLLPPQSDPPSDVSVRPKRHK